MLNLRSCVVINPPSLCKQPLFQLQFLTASVKVKISTQSLPGCLDVPFQQLLTGCAEHGTARKVFMLLGEALVNVCRRTELVGDRNKVIILSAAGISPFVLPVLPNSCWEGLIFTQFPTGGHSSRVGNYLSTINPPQPRFSESSMGI